MDDLQTGTHGPLGIVLMRFGPAEVDHQPIAQVLRHMPRVAFDHVPAGLLISTHHLAQLLRIEFAREFGRTDQVAEHDRELAALAFGTDGFSFKCQTPVELGDGFEQFLAVAQRDT